MQGIFIGLRLALHLVRKLSESMIKYFPNLEALKFYPTLSILLKTLLLTTLSHKVYAPALGTLLILRKLFLTKLLEYYVEL